VVTSRVKRWTEAQTGWVLSREITPPGRRRCALKRKATRAGALTRVLVRPCAVGRLHPRLGCGVAAFAARYRRERLYLLRQTGLSVPHNWRSKPCSHSLPFQPTRFAPGAGLGNRGLGVRALRSLVSSTDNQRCAGSPNCPQVDR
jgi:hypothetical protein